MAKSEAEILQQFKDFVKTKNLSITERTMLKFSAQIAALNVEDETLEEQLINNALESFETISGQVRYERSQQRSADEEEFRVNKTDPPKGTATPKAPVVELPDDIKAAMSFINEMKREREASSVRTSIEGIVYDKGIPRTQKEFVNDFLSTINISSDTNAAEVADKIVSAYNRVISNVGDDTVVRRAGGVANVKELEATFKKAADKVLGK